MVARWCGSNNSKIAQTLTDRLHFNTFGGNPVVCAQGNRVLDIIERENMQANSLNIGSKILGALHELKEKYKLLGDVRGKGLLLLHRITAGSTIEGVGE